MKIIDITRGLLSAPLCPGDLVSERIPVSRIDLGDESNRSRASFSMHAATHVDAPLHVFPDGEDVASLDPERLVGECQVVEHDGVLLGDEAERMVEKLRYSRLLIKGDVTISPSAAAVLADSDIDLIGVEGASVATAADSMAVHRQLLGGGVLLLEGLDLHEVAPGVYLLLAAPLKIAGAEAAPVRALLLERQLSL